MIDTVNCFGRESPALGEDIAIYGIYSGVQLGGFDLDACGSKSASAIID